jgi:NADPH-dependent 2,4-dienoyl-CoA reductase/sulfur reductase-like enzyme
MKVIVVGRVAGSASARLRRLDEKAEIPMVEREPYVSIRNCGLPLSLKKFGTVDDVQSLLISNLPLFEGLNLNEKSRPA